MNKWILTGIIVVALLVIIGILYDQGAFDSLQWSGWAIVVSALAAPFMAIKNALFGNKYQKDFQLRYKEMRKETIQHRIDLDQKIKEKEQRIAQLDKELELIDAKMNVLELKKKNVEKEVHNMSIDETKQEVQDLFGD
jgi:flagellar motor component MotA